MVTMYPGSCEWREGLGGIQLKFGISVPVFNLEHPVAAYILASDCLDYGHFVFSGRTHPFQGPLQVPTNLPTPLRCQLVIMGYTAATPLGWPLLESQELVLQEGHIWTLAPLIQQTFSPNKPAPDGLAYESVQLQLRLLHDACPDTIVSCHIRATHPIEKPETPPPSRTTTVHPKQPRSGNMPLHAPAPSHRTISSASHGHQHRSGDVSTTTGPVTTTTTTTTTTIGPSTTTATTIGPVTTTTTTTPIGPVTTSTPCLPMPDLGCKADNASVVDYKPLPSDQPPAGLAGITMLHLAEPAPLAGQGCEVPAFDPMAQELQAALEEVFGDWDIPAAGMWVQQAGGSWLQPCEMEEAKPGSSVTLLGKRKCGYEDGNPLLGSPSCSALTCPNSTALGASLLPTASAQATSCYSPCCSSPAGQQQQQEEEEQQQGGDEGQSG